MLQRNVVCSKGQRKRYLLTVENIQVRFGEQIDEAFQFVLRNIHLGATIVGIYRQDVL